MSVKIVRTINHFSRDYQLRRISCDGLKAYFELTTTNAFTGEVLERATFDDEVQANIGLLDRVAFRG